MKSFLPFKSRSKKQEVNKQELPIKEINQLVQTKDNKYKIVLKVTDPINSELLADDDLEVVIQALQDCCNALNQKAQILISSERIDVTKYIDYLKEKALKADDNYELERIEEKINFLNDRSNTTRNVHNFYFVIESKFTKINDAYDELVDLSNSFIEYLSFADMGTITLDEYQIKKILYEKLNPSTSLTQPFTKDMNLTSIAPASIKDNGSSLEMDGWHYNFYTFSNFPDEVEPSWLKRILNSRTNLDFSLTLNPSDKSTVMKGTSKKILALEGNLLGKLPAMSRKKFEKELKSLEILIEELNSDTENLFDSTFILAIREENKEDLESASKRLETAINSSRLRSKKLVFRGTQLMWYTLPICYSNNDFERQINWPFQSSTISSIIPFDSSELQQNEGILKGFHATKHSPIIYDRFNSSIFNNPNECIMGESGSGKSFYVKTDILRESTSGKAKRIFVIDPDREYYFPNAKRIEFKLGSEFSTNPFHIRSAIVDHEDDESKENEIDSKQDVGNYLRLKIGEMVSFFKWIIPSLTASEEAILLKAIVEVYKNNKGGALTFESKELPSTFPTLSDLYELLSKEYKENMMNVIASLSPYCKVDDGVYASMFDGQTNWDLKSKITILDIHELSESVQKPMYDLLLKEIWEEIKIDRNEAKGFYVDEAHILADENNLQTMKFLFTLYKRIRKYGGFATVATQNVADFISVGKYGSAILNNSFIKTFMRMSEKDIKELSSFMTFSSKELKVLGQKKTKGKCIHMTTGKRLEMQVVASLDEIKIIDPKQAKKLLIN